MEKNPFIGKDGKAVLQTLLSYVVKKEMAIGVAQKLIGTLGSFSSVLEAPESEIESIGELNTKTVKFLKSLKWSTEYYLEDKASDLNRVYDTQSAVEVLKPKFLGKKREVVALLLLDGRGRILYNDIVNEGSISEVPIYVRRLVELCLKHDVYNAIIAHNHPSGNPLPSRNDINATRDLEFALNGIDVELTDHLIFAGMDYTSMKSSEWLDQIKEEVNRYKKALRKESMEQEKALFARLNQQED